MSLLSLLVPYAFASKAAASAVDAAASTAAAALYGRVCCDASS
jgi:hypothetical protein